MSLSGRALASARGGGAVRRAGMAGAARSAPRVSPPAAPTRHSLTHSVAQARPLWTGWWRRRRAVTPRAVTTDGAPDTDLARAHRAGEQIGFGFSGEGLGVVWRAGRRWRASATRPDSARANPGPPSPPAGGLLFPYYIGAAFALQDLGLITPSTPLAGASAGSLIAACVAAGLPRDEVEGACLALADDCREGGTRGRLGGVLRDFLEEHLPADAAVAVRDRVHVAVTPVAAARPRSVLVSDFASRDDLIAALLTSCHIPFWMDGTAARAFRGAPHLDGGLTAFLPLPPGCHGVGVCCFPSAGALGGLMGEGRLIAPDAYGGSAGAPYQTLLAWAFNPAPEADLRAMAVKGEADALAWAAAELGIKGGGEGEGAAAAAAAAAAAE